MNKIQSLLGLLLATCLFSSPLLAELPSWYPDKYDWVGVIDKVNKNTIYIDDGRFHISPTLKYATETNKDASISRLQKGLLVGFNILTINNRHIVDRIWLIPKSQRAKYRPLEYQ